MKMPNFASLHQAGVGRLSMDSQFGVEVRCACAAADADASTGRASTRLRSHHRPQSRWNTSVMFDHHSSARGGGPLLLHGLHERPPALRLRIRRHGAHVGREVVAHVLEVREQDSVAQVDRVVADVRAMDLLEHARPDRRVVPHVVVAVFGPEFAGPGRIASRQEAYLLWVAHRPWRRRLTDYGSLSWVLVRKSPASCRSRSWLDGSPVVRLTLRPRCTAGRALIVSAQRRTCVY